MGRPLTVFLPLPHDREAADLLVAPPDRWLPEGSVVGGPDVWSVPLRGAVLQRSVACTVGPPWRTGDGVWRALSWGPLPEEGDVAPMERLLPSFRGELGVAQVHRSGPSLVLAGTYEVPAGAVGELVDAVMLRRVAQRTGTGFLIGISRNLRDRDVVSA